MTNTNELEIDVEDIGTILKSSRLKSKKSLEDISSELCIRKIYLTALEEGDYETLPPIPYGVGYVRTYANYLGLNPERAVKLYKDASIVPEEPIKEVIEEPKVDKSNKNHLFLGILAVLVIYLLWHFGINRAPQDNATVKQEEVVVEKVQEDVETVITKEESDEEKVTEEEKQVKEENKQDNKQEEANPLKEDNKIVFEMKGETWVEVKGKNKVYLSGVFHKGDRKEIEYMKGLFISVGRPKNLSVIVNGKNKNIVAARRKINIPLDSLE